MCICKISVNKFSNATAMENRSSLSGFTVCLSNAVNFIAIDVLSNTIIRDIRNYANAIHLKYVYFLQAIMNNIYSSCGYILSYVKRLCLI